LFLQVSTDLSMVCGSVVWKLEDFDMRKERLQRRPFPLAGAIAWPGGHRPRRQSTPSPESIIDFDIAIGCRFG
jgi:hypothetical protein